MADRDENWRWAYAANMYVKGKMYLGSPISLGVEATESFLSPLPIGQILEGPARPPAPVVPGIGIIEGFLKAARGQIAKQAMRMADEADEERRRILENAQQLPSGAVRELLVARTATEAMRIGAGNCAEQSSIATVFLRDRNRFPIDLAFWGNFAGKYGGHAFVILGRQDNSAIEDPATWGEACVICDPQKTGLVFAANMIEFYFGKKRYELFLRLTAKTQYSQSVTE